MAHTLKGYLSTRQACETYGISRATLLRWMQDGLDSLKIGQARFFTKEQINQYLKAKDKRRAS